MNNIFLEFMTRELCHKYFQSFENDFDVFEDVSVIKPYEYDRDKVDKYFESQMLDNRIVFLVMQTGKPIGEVKLKDIDRETKACSLGIHLQNDAVKGRSRYISWRW